jgi:hypothetical protein
MVPAAQSSPSDVHGCKLKLEDRSNSVTLQTVFSKTISMASHHDEYCSEARSLQTNSFMLRSRGTEHDVAAVVSSSSSLRLPVSTCTSGDSKKKKKGLRRRGLLSSDVPSKNSRFQISSDLEKLVRTVFDRPIEDNNEEDSSENCSEFTTSSEETRPTQRRRSMASHSMCSSVSSLAGLGGEFSNSLKIDSWQKGSKVSRRRKIASARAAKSEKVSFAHEPEIYSSFKVKVVDETNGSLLYRSLSSYDILCNLDVRPKIMLCNHVGNNRFRIMLKMHQARYNAHHASLTDKNHLVHDILENTLNSEKGPSNFVFQDPDNVNFWVQIPRAFVPKLIVCCFEDCHHYAELQMLPPFTEKPWIKSLCANQPGTRQQTMEDLHVTALKNIRKRKQKKPISNRDKGAIAQLQNSVLMNNTVHEETTKCDGARNQ